MLCGVVGEGRETGVGGGGWALHVKLHADAARLAARFVTRGCTEGRRRSKNGWTLELY